MKPLDLVASTLKAVSIVNIFLCAYNLWMLSQMGNKLKGGVKLQRRQDLDGLQRKVNEVLSNFEESNKRRIKQYPDLGLPKTNSARFGAVCKRCTEIVKRIQPTENAVRIPDICLAIYAKAFVPTNDWVSTFFTEGGKIKDDPYSDQNNIAENVSSQQLNALRTRLRELKAQYKGVTHTTLGQ